MRGTTIVLEYEVNEVPKAFVVRVVENEGPEPCKKCREASRMSGGLITECVDHERRLYGKALRG